MSSVPLVPPPSQPSAHGELSPRYRALVAAVLGSLLLFGVLYVGFGALLLDHLRLSWELIRTDQASWLTWITLVPSALVFLLLASGLLALRPAGAREPEAGVLVDPTEQPTLVAFVHAVADRVGAPRPVRIWLVPEVNAAVRYDPRLGNLFRGDKELLIGLGLVNALSLDELQAVLAHEFGHFAQRSMRLGAWVQTVNHVMGRLVTAHTPMDTLVSVVSRIDLRVAWLGWLTAALFWAVRRLLEGAFWVLNVPERALTREMEFQADGVAVASTGSDSLVHALKRLVVADEALDRALTRVMSRATLGRGVGDVFEEQSRVLASLRKTGNEVPERPEPPRADHRVFADEALPPQMWSSHPPSRQRELRAKEPYVPSHLDDRPGWVVFDDPARAREQVMVGVAARMNLGLDEENHDPSGTDDPLLTDPRFDGLEDDFLTRHHATLPELVASVPDDLDAALANRYGAAFQALLARRDASRAELQTLAEIGAGHRELVDGRFPLRGTTHAASALPELFRAARDARADAEQETLDALDTLRGAAHAAAAELGPEWVTAHEEALTYLRYAEHELTEVQRVSSEADDLLAWGQAQAPLDEGQMKGFLDHFDTLHVAMRGVWGRSGAAESPRDDVPHPAPPADPGPPDPLTYDPSWVTAFLTSVNTTRLRLYGATQMATSHLRRLEDAIARARHDPSVARPASRTPRVPTDHRVHVQDIPTSIRSAELPTAPKTGEDRWKQWGGMALAACLVGSLVVARFASATATVQAYNGGGLPTVVEVNGEVVELGPRELRAFPLWGGGPVELVARVGTTELERRTEHVASATAPVWNVAGRGVLLVDHVVYSTDASAPPREPDLLGATSWVDSSFDTLFRDPPDQVDMPNLADVVVKDVLHDISKDTDLLDLALGVRQRFGDDAMAQWLRTVLLMDPPGDHTSAFVALLARHDPEQSDTTVDQLVARHPDDVAVHRALQDVRSDVHDLAYYEARASSRDDADSHYLLGRVQDDRVAALASYERALALDPRHRFATCAWAMALGDLQRFSEAAEAFDACGRDVAGPWAKVLRASGADADTILDTVPTAASDRWLSGMLQASDDLAVIDPNDAFDPAFGAILRLHRGDLEAVRAWLSSPDDNPAARRVRALAALTDDAVSIDGLEPSDPVAAVAIALRTGATEGLHPALAEAVGGPLRNVDDTVAVLRGVDIDVQGLVHVVFALRGAPGHADRARRLTLLDERPPLPTRGQGPAGVRGTVRP